MPVATLGLIAATILATSFLSGVFGMAGGMILLGVLLIVLDVAPAMVLFGVTQTAANGWRAWLWRAHVVWPIIAGYAVGSLAMFGLMKLVAFVPDKAVIYIGMGLLPFLADRLPAAWRPDITRRFAPPLCGAVIMGLSITAGVAGNILDVFFQRSPLDRKQVVATKAASQVMAHGLRIVYFGALARLTHESLPWWSYVAAVALAMAGTTAAASVLARMTDADFRLWSRRIILAVSLVYLVRGVALLVTG